MTVNVKHTQIANLQAVKIKEATVCGKAMCNYVPIQIHKPKKQACSVVIGPTNTNDNTIQFGGKRVYLYT